MTYQTLGVGIDKRVATVTLNRPPVNAINSAMIAELGAVFGELATNRAVKAVVLTGEGKNFAAGADIKEIAALAPGGEVAAFSQRGNEAFFAIENLRKPVIAAVRGFCLGGGCELAMACHIRLADHAAQFGQPEIKLGISPGFAASQRLPRLVGVPAAIRLIMTGESIGAEEAARLGLVQQVMGQGKDVLKAAADLAAGIAQFSLVTIERTMEAIVEGTKRPLVEGAALESRIFGDLSDTKDMREGFAAFLGKRAPNFVDA